MFEVWGYQTPPEPPPKPVISNWAPMQLEYVPIADGYKVIFRTDNECHLYMRWSLVYPQVHKIPRYRRGIWLFDDKRFCFVVYHENEQEEAGDTLVHTFIKTNWPVCQTRYFYFVGTKQTEQQSSTSALFTKHRYEPPVGELIIDHDPDFAGATRVYTDEWHGNTFVPPYDVRLTSIWVRHNILVWPACAHGIMHITETPIDHEPLPEIIATSTIDLPGLPDHPDTYWIEYPFEHPLLLGGHMYCFLAAGCIPWAGAEGHQIAHAISPGHCLNCTMWQWRGTADPPEMLQTTGWSRQHKIYGYPP
ncbi:hypothetical protein ES703_102696 [subsurface metagenome]